MKRTRKNRERDIAIAARNLVRAIDTFLVLDYVGLANEVHAKMVSDAEHDYITLRQKADDRGNVRAVRGRLGKVKYDYGERPALSVRANGYV